MLCSSPKNQTKLNTIAAKMGGSTMTQMIPFTHNPLSNQRRQIRLLKFDKPGTSGQISCSIQAFDVDSAPPYVALSYEWGAPQPSQHILVNQRSFVIRQNLHDFLTHAYQSERVPCGHVRLESSAQGITTYEWGPPRPPQQRFPTLPPALLALLPPAAQVARRSRYDGLFEFSSEGSASINIKASYLWIDQVCIDQTNLSERGSQVAMMGDIYRNAKSTVSWLGLDDSLEPLTFNSDPSGVSDLAEDEARWWRALFERSYWGRLWVVQEICLSPNLAVMVGRSMFHWDRVMKAHQDLMTTGLRDQKPWFSQRLSALSRASIEGRWKLRDGAFIGRELISLILSFVEWNCTDPRDKVYGLLSLAKLEDRITADYSVAAEDVFAKVMTIARRSFVGDDIQYFQIANSLLSHLSLQRRDDLFLQISLPATSSTTALELTTRAKDFGRFWQWYVQRCRQYKTDSIRILPGVPAHIKAESHDFSSPECKMIVL